MLIMNGNQCAAGIVLFKPDIDRLKENIDAVAPQVQSVYCFNNGVENMRALEQLLSSYSNIRLIGEGKNLGIATALNKLIEQADNDDIKWILTLDQDSVVSYNMVAVLASLTNQTDVAIICPQIEDVRRKNEKAVYTSDTVEDVSFCITSGSLMNVKKTIEIGGFDDYLFIGLVDDEICYRVRLTGYKILRNNAVVLNHELGNLTPSKHERMWLNLGTALNSERIKKLSYKREVSPMRLYYATRNMIYLKRKYINYIESKYWNRRAIINSISSLIRGDRKIDVLSAIIKGIRDGSAYSVSPIIIIKKD